MGSLLTTRGQGLPVLPPAWAPRRVWDTSPLSRRWAQGWRWGKLPSGEAIKHPALPPRCKVRIAEPENKYWILNLSHHSMMFRIHSVVYVD